jgi:hypothetical protein
MRTHCFLLLIALLVPTLAAADPVLPAPMPWASTSTLKRVPST